MIKSIPVLLLLLFTKNFLEAQPYYFKNYQVTNGVSSNTITCIMQDKKGFMWFGSRNGLNRFDGMSFRIFRNSPSDPSSLGSNSILSLHEDQGEQVWVGTYKGIYLYDPVSEKFSPFTRLPQNEIRYITAQGQYMWVVAGLGLYRYDTKSGTVKSYTTGTPDIINLAISLKGTIWTATRSGVIKKYDAVKDQFIEFNVSYLLGVDSSNQIQDIYPVDDSSVLVGSRNKAFFLNVNAFTATSIFEAYPWRHEVQVHEIVRQSEYEYWFGTEAGIYIYNTETRTSVHIEKEPENQYALTDNVITTFCRDAEGGTWVGTFSGGVNYYSKQYNRFHKYFPHPGKNHLSGNLVHEITSDRYGNIWVGTEDAGLNKIDARTGAISFFLPGKAKGSLSYRNLHGIVADGDELWIGTYEHGLDVMDIKTGKVIRHYKAGNGPNTLRGDFVVTLYKTRNNDIIAGTWNGMFVYNRKTDDFTAHPFFTMQIQSIHEDKNGTLWVASYGNGIYFYNARTRESGHLEYDAKNTNSIPNNYVNSLFADSQGKFWFCTEGGLCHFDPVTGKIIRFYNENGLPDNQVFRILEDNQARFWVSTAKGLFFWDATNKASQVYTTSHGLLTNQFNYNSSFKTADGTMYFGSVKGLVRFNPSDFIRNTFVPPVYITGLQINNKDVTVQEVNSPLQKSITHTDEITVAHDHSNITIDVAALSYSLPEMNAYQYKMDVLDKEWTTLKMNRKIYYNKLAPGNYTFRVRGSNSDGVWNRAETKLSIKVQPPFWAGNLAYLIYTCLGAAMVLIIIRYYHNTISAKNARKIELLEIEKEREIYNAKIQFFTNIAHEIRTPLTLIKMPLDKLMRKSWDNAEIKDNLDMMRKNTDRLVDLTNQLLDFRKIESDKIKLNFTRVDVNALLKEVYESFRPAAEQKSLLFKLELPRIGLQASIDKEAIRKILSNLINNAVKYAEKTVTVKMQPFNSEDILFNIEIKNDGYLIPYTLKEKIFEPFYRITATDKEQGTGIGLALSRSLAELHKGIIELRQPENDLNVFIVSLPIFQETEITISDTPSGSQVERAPKQLEAAPIDPAKPTLLLVEDNEEILGFISNELKSDYNILQAHHGEEALQVSLKENIDLVISDIMMPIMDGIELCRKMKSDLQYSHTPIILLTAKNSLDARIQGLEVGADAYLEKPFAFEHLQAQITNLLTNRNIIKEYFARSPLTNLRGIAVSKPDKDFIERLNQIIYENITNMSLDVDQLSKLMNMSRPTFYRKIKALSDLTPNELINLTRLKKASELLASGKYKIAEVAHLVGYTLPTNFSRDFHKQFGVSPSQYVTGLQRENKT